jgi:hypothetical protein
MVPHQDYQHHCLLLLPRLERLRFYQSSRRWKGYLHHPRCLVLLDLVSMSLMMSALYFLPFLSRSNAGNAMYRIVIHVLLLGSMVYQFTPAGKVAIIDGISWRLPLLGVLNGIFVALAARQHYIPGACPNVLKGLGG